MLFQYIVVFKFGVELPLKLIVFKVHVLASHHRPAARQRFVVVDLGIFTRFTTFVARDEVFGTILSCCFVGATADQTH